MKLDNYECDGQMNIFDFISTKEPIFAVDIRGICDDAYCPKCNYPLDATKELDCERCPDCRIKIDWSPWHKMNDDWEMEEI